MTVGQLKKLEERSIGRSSTLLDSAVLCGGKIVVAVLEMAPLHLKGVDRAQVEVRCAQWSKRGGCSTTIVDTRWEDPPK